MTGVRVKVGTSGTAFAVAPATGAADNVGGIVPRAVALVHQRGAFGYSASVEGLFTQTRGGLRTADKAHETLHLALRTVTAYWDSDVVVAHVWTTAEGIYGRRAPATGVKLVVTKGGSPSGTKTISCGDIRLSRVVRLCGGP